MNYRHYVAILIYSLALMACGAKQTPEVETEPAIDQIITSEAFETIHREHTLRSREMMPLGQSTFQRTPSYTFRVDEPRALEIVAESQAADLLLLIIGPSFPYQDDDTYDFHPAVEDTFEPGLYRVHVGAWGAPSHNVTYTLSVYDVESGQRHEHTDGEYTGGPTPEFQDLSDYVDRPYPTEAAHYTLDGTNVQNQKHDVVLKPAYRTDDCPGFFDFNRPVATLDRLDGLQDDRLRIVLDRAEDARPVDTVMAIYLDGILLHCTDDFESLFAGRDFSKHDYLGPELTVYGGVWDPNVRDENGEVRVGLTATRLSPEDWQSPVQQRTLTADTQFVGIKGSARDAVATLTPAHYGMIRNTQRPDVALTVARDHSTVQIDARLNADDAVLLIRTPSGEFLFNDDRPDNQDARIFIQDASKGTYDIWIGTNQANADLEGLLSISSPKAYDDADRRLRKLDTIGQERQSEVRAAKPVDVTGNQTICDGFAFGHLDLQSPSIVLKNDTQEDAILLVRTDNDFDTILYSPHNTETCGDDEIIRDAAIAVPLIPGESTEVWAGAVEQVHARDNITLRYILFTYDMLSESERFDEFITP